MSEKSIYAVGRNAFGFGMLIEGDSTYVSDEHDAEKSDLSKLVEFARSSCIKYGLEKVGFNITLPYGKEGRCFVLSTKENSDGLGNVGVGVMIGHCTSEGEDLKFVFTKDEASDIASCAYTFMNRVKNGIEIELGKKQPRVTFYKVDRHMEEINRDAVTLNTAINHARYLSEMARLNAAPTVTHVREQVAIAM